MPLIRHRSHTKELLDRNDIPFAHIAQNMHELDLINRRLGGHRTTLNGVQQVLKGKTSVFKNGVSVVEIGCGGGDNLRVIRQWALRNGIAIQLTGVDINPECIAYARALPQNEGIRFDCADYRNASFDTVPHLIFSSLFCHHFTDTELVTQLQWMQQQAATGFFINDLHRHPIAYHSIRLLTQWFSKSYLVKNDAPLSVMRGFVRGDWQRLMQQAGITNYNCQWQWPFRWLITWRR